MDAAAPKLRRELTSSTGVLMSMGSITVNSFFTFFTVDQGLCSLAFTQ